MGSKTQTITIRIQEGQFLWLAKLAEENRTTLAEAARRAITSTMEADKNAERLAAMEARLMAKIDQVQSAVEELGVEEG